MPSLDSALDNAVREKILSPQQRAALGTFLAGQGVTATAGDTDTAAGFDDQSDSETPRFLRGFHDILITIGILIVTVGLWTFGTLALVIPAAWLMAEIFVKRQRLALPAFALTLIFAVSTACTFSLSYLGIDSARQLTTATTAQTFLLIAALLAPFYWRFRVPVALAGCLLCLAGAACAGVFLAAGLVSGSEIFVLDHPMISVFIAMLFAIALFCVAMWFDIADPHRRSTRSDTAFWLHLCAAPLLLFSISSFLLMAVNLRPFQDTASGSYSTVVLPVVIVLMLVGVIIDRRAFVTGGLISLGMAIAAIMSELNLGLTDYASITLVLVGLIVLTIGSNWVRVRKLILSILPESMQARLPRSV
ncbi:MAG: hypothetical protein RIM72_06770 [Alphaproteobacteria bacterium]